MKLNPLARAVGLTTLGLALTFPFAAQAAFIEDSKASLELRNFYMNRDFRNNNSANTAEEWAQGFLLRYESGFTEGTVGVGVDAYGFAGIKLDSSDARNNPGTGLLPKRRSGKNPHDAYGRAGAAAKARISKSTLKAGTMRPRLPTVQSHDGRLLPVTFQGVHVNSQEISNLTVDLGQLGRVSQRDSTDSEPLRVNIAQGSGVNKNLYRTSTRVNRGESSRFDFAGANYKWGDSGLSTAYHYSNLDDVYKQHILNGIYTLKFTDKQSLKTDLRYAKTKEDGKSGIDNKAFSGMITYFLGYNSFAVTYQKMSGDSGYAYIQGTDPYLTNFVQVRDFGAKDEKSWQARYDYNFAGMGIPGLNLMVRYIKGSNIYMGANQKRGREWERDTDISYVFQSGALKNLGIKLRNATVRTNMKGNTNIDENRLIVSYTIPLL